MRHWGRPAALSLLAAALVMSGCSEDAAPEQTNTTAPAAETTSPPGMATAEMTTAETTSPVAVPAGKGAPVDAVERALQTAAGAVPNGRPFDLELETEDGRRVFDIEVASDGNEFEVRVNEAGTEVVGQRRAGDPGDDVAKAEAAQVDATRALQTALEREPGATVDEIQIDTERDVIVWQIELVRPDGSEAEIDVDARSGAIAGG